jgi:hypothetical protein
LIIAGSCDDDTGFVTPATTEAAAPSGFDASSLPATFDIDGFGYQIDYPDGWHTAMAGNQARIAEDPLDLVPDEPLHKITLHIEHAGADDLAGAGFDAATGVDGFLEFNAQFHPWPQPLQTESITVGDAPALKLRASHPDPDLDIEFLHVLGELGGRYYMMTLAVTPADDTDAFLPVFDAMLASVRSASSSGS